MKVQSEVFGFWEVCSEYAYVDAFSYLLVYFEFQIYHFKKKLSLNEQCL